MDVDLRANTKKTHVKKRLDYVLKICETNIPVTITNLSGGGLYDHSITWRIFHFDNIHE